jgi:hypothetical protein
LQFIEAMLKTGNGGQAVRLDIGKVGSGSVTFDERKGTEIEIATLASIIKR